MQRSLFFIVMLTSIYEVIFYRKSYLLFQKKCFGKKMKLNFCELDPRSEVKDDFT